MEAGLAAKGRREVLDDRNGRGQDVELRGQRDVERGVDLLAAGRASPRGAAASSLLSSLWELKERLDVEAFLQLGADRFKS